MATVKANKIAYPFQKVSQELIDVILQDIKEGAPRKHASEANGISYRHFLYLIAQGIVDMEVGNLDTLQSRMVRTLRNIEMKEIKGCKSDIRISKEGHKGAQWTLEHVYWKWFGNNAEAKELSEEIEQLRAQVKGGQGNDEIDNKEKKQDSEK